MEQYLHLYVWCTVESQNGKLVMGRHLAQTCRVRLRSDHTLTINEPLWSLSKSSYCSCLGSHLHKQNAPRGGNEEGINCVWKHPQSLFYVQSERQRRQVPNWTFLYQWRILFTDIWSGYIGSWSDAWWPKSMLLLPKCVKENWQEQELKRWWTKLQQSRKTVLLSNLRLLLKPCCWRAYCIFNNRYDCQDLEILHINGTKISLSHCSLSHTHASCSSPCVPSH